MTKMKRLLDQELVGSCVLLSPPAPAWPGSSSVLRHPPTNTIPGVFPIWLALFERITRSTGQAVRTLPSSKSKNIIRPFSFGDEQRENSYELTQLGKRLCYALKNAWPFDSTSVEQSSEKGKLEAPEMRYSPALSLLFESAEERDLAQLIRVSITERQGLIWFCDIINGFCDQIRARASSARFREKQKEFLRVPNENYRWLKALIDECFTGNEHLYYAYMDLGYSPKIDAMPATFFAQAKADGQTLRSLLDNKERWPSTILGYGLNLRYLPYNGYHYRLFVICQPNEKTQTALTSTAIEKEWENITAQTGVVFNHRVNARDGSQEKIARKDDAARNTLREKLYFLTQLDSLVRLRLAPKDHHFFRGEKRG